jgi:molecular chaperone DnaK (HSP70)
MTKAVSIDLGRTNSSIAVWKGVQADVILNIEGGADHTVGGGVHRERQAAVG